MNVRTIAVGPVALKFKPTRLDRNDEWLGHDVGGHVEFDDTKGRYLTSKIDAIITAAGPLANLATFILGALTVQFVVKTGILAAILIGFSLSSLSAFALSAWPLRTSTGRANDALHLIQILWPRTWRKPRFGKQKRSGWQAR